MSLLIGIAIACAVPVALIAGYVWGARHADAMWASRGWPLPGRKEHNDRVYWVVDANAPESCAALLEILEIQQDGRESSERVERIRKGAA